jgi:ABC-type branched-subunit amino acid transport system substrate-binding protein
MTIPHPTHKEDLVLSSKTSCCRTGGLGLLLTLLLPGTLRGDEIVIGMSAAFKGPSRGLGIELYRGSMAYFEHVNRTGGVHGRKIVIKTYDDGYNPIPAIENTRRLIERDKVFLLYGYVGTPTVTRVLPLLKKNSDHAAYLFFPFTGAEPHRQPPYNEYVFNLRASYSQETAGLVDRFVEQGNKRIAVFYQIDAYGRSGWDGVRKALARHRLQIVGEATYRRGTPFTDSLSRQVEILRKAKADVVISIGAYEACAAFIRDARDAGWNVPIANVSFVGSENLLGLLLKTGKDRGKDYTSNLVNSQVVPSYHNTTFPAVIEYRKLMDRYQPLPPPAFRSEGYQPLPHGFVSFEGFLNAKLLVEVLKKLGPKLDRKRLKEIVESIDQLDLGIGVPVSFGAGKHQGLDQIYCTEVRDGRFVPVTDWKRWRK